MSRFLVFRQINRSPKPKTLIKSPIKSINVSFSFKSELSLKFRFSVQGESIRLKTKCQLPLKTKHFSSKAPCLSIQWVRGSKRPDGPLASFIGGSVLISRTALGGSQVVHDLLVPVDPDKEPSVSKSRRDLEALEDVNLLQTLIDPEYLNMAVLAYYEMEASFFIDNFPYDIPLVVIKNKPRQAFEDALLFQSRRSKLAVSYAPSKTSMHLKTMLLYFPGFLRVVIGSGDLVENDWKRTGNLCYVQDFPLRNESQQDEGPGVYFRSILQDMMTKLEADHDIPESLNKYNFNAARGWPVTSVPGIHKDDCISSYGHPALSRIVRKEKLVYENKGFPNSDVHYMCTALGMLSTKWLKEFQNSALGFPPRILPEKFHGLSKLKIYFPTASDVQQLNLSRPFRSFYNSRLSNLKRVMFRMPASRIKILASLPAMKRMLSVPNRTPSPWAIPDGFFYCGSHNCSYSAWGKLIELDQLGKFVSPINDQAGKISSTLEVEIRPAQMALKICNFELGMIIPNSDLNQADLHKLLHCAPPYSKADHPWSTPTSSDLRLIQYTPAFDPRPSGFEFQDMPAPMTDTQEPFYAEEPEHFSSADSDDEWMSPSAGIQGLVYTEGPVYTEVPSPNLSDLRPPAYAENHLYSQNTEDRASTSSYFDFKGPSDSGDNWTSSDLNSPPFTDLTPQSSIASRFDFEDSPYTKKNTLCSIRF